MDVLVHASTAPEPFGRVIIEGMAAGTPVVGTNAGAVPEIIEDKVTGLLVPPGDAGAMAEAIAWVLEHPQEAQAMRLAARRAVELRFTTERYVQGVERVYEEILR
jgi:glycosyltransferase involved in cell wall biosynthesis